MAVALQYLTLREPYLAAYLEDELNFIRSQNPRTAMKDGGTGGTFRLFEQPIITGETEQSQLHYLKHSISSLVGGLDRRKYCACKPPYSRRTMRELLLC